MLLAQRWRGVQESNLSGQGCSLPSNRLTNASNWWKPWELNPYVGPLKRRLPVHCGLTSKGGAHGETRTLGILLGKETQ